MDALEKLAADMGRLLDAVDRIEGRLSASPTANAAKPAQSGGAVADATDLDGKYGDEELKFHLKEKWWQGGGDYAGKRMSQCPADYLDAVAKANDAQAHMMNKSGDAEEAKKAVYRSRTAARARGWAARIRSGAVKQIPFDDADGDIPF